MKTATAPDELDAAYDPYSQKSVYEEEETFDVFIRANYRDFVFGLSGVLPFSHDRIVIQASARQRVASLIKGTSLSASHIRQFCPKARF